MVGKIYSGTPLRADDPQIVRWPRCHLDEWKWEDVIASLQTARLYVTGDVYGVYAAALARVPFVTVQERGQDIAGLVAWYGRFTPPSIKHRSSLFEAIEWALSHRDLYEDFFDWIGEHPCSAA